MLNKEDLVSSISTLRTVMRIQAIAFFAYGASFLLVPDFALGTLFGYDVETLWPRALGAAFLGITWAEWNVFLLRPQFSGGDDGLAPYGWLLLLNP